MAMLNNQRVLYILSYQKLWDDLKPIIGLQCAGQILLCKPLQVSRVVGKLPSSCDKVHFFLVKSHVLFWKSPILSWWNLQLFPQKHRISSPCLQLRSNIWWNLHFSCLNYHVWVVKWPFFFVKPIIFWANSPQTTVRGTAAASTFRSNFRQASRPSLTRSSKVLPFTWDLRSWMITYPIGSMYAIYANIGGILMVNVTIYTIHGSYGYGHCSQFGV